jgi:(2Fe-2S) ferredoxin
MDKSKLNAVHKKYFPVIIVFMIALLSNGCDKKDIHNIEGKPLAKIEQKTTVNFIGHWYKEGKREDLVRNFVREYSLKNQEVNINLKFPEEVYYNREDLYSNRKFVVSVLKEENRHGISSALTVNILRFQLF